MHRSYQGLAFSGVHEETSFSRNRPEGSRAGRVNALRSTVATSLQASPIFGHQVPDLNAILEAWRRLSRLGSVVTVSRISLTLSPPRDTQATCLCIAKAPNRPVVRAETPLRASMLFAKSEGDTKLFKNEQITTLLASMSPVSVVGEDGRERARRRVTGWVQSER